MITPPIVRLGGSPHTVGFGHGTKLADEIRATLQIYRMVLGLNDEQALFHGHRIRDAIVAFHPPLVDELEGIAQGAKIPAHWIYLLNGRSELMGRRSDGCTTIYSPGSGVLAQTWDWLRVFEPLMVVLDIELECGLRAATLTEPGIATKIGLNSAGVGIALNFMSSADRLDGAPIHAVLHRLLRCRTLAEITTVIDEAGIGRAGHVTAVGPDSPAMSIEFLGNTTRIDVTTNGFAHTNHSVHDPVSGGDLLENSAARLRTATWLISNVDSHHAAFEALASQEGLHPICAPYVMYQGVEIGTVATVAMELAARRLHVRLGPAANGPTTTVDLSKPHPGDSDN